jgi:DNA (cytosine-5)-methyltransferase 1
LEGGKTFSDARVFTILELFRIFGLPDNYPIPEFAKTNDRLIREMIGEGFCPKLAERILLTMPR